ncbi:hypothetical protein GGU11DRAFT_755150 [Lentinula aff. detonsa]|nr:hypothetical protein GGU11DRAFT_755150 [Lentinula aff. detonsa]
MFSNPLWKYFHKRDKQYSSHYATRCKFCIQHFKESSAAEFEERLNGADDATKLEILKEQFDAAIQWIFFSSLCRSNKGKQSKHKHKHKPRFHVRFIQGRDSVN